MKTLNKRLRQYMVYFCFSSHLQVTNKVYEQCSALLQYRKHSALLCDKKVFVLYKQIIIIGNCPAAYLISKSIKS